jgi:hypothetical protein
LGSLLGMSPVTSLVVGRPGCSFVGEEGAGGIPVLHRAFDGGAGEVSEVIPVMKALQEMATQRRLLIVGDSRRRPPNPHL